MSMPIISEAMELETPLVSYESDVLPMQLNSDLMSDTMSLSTLPSYVEEQLVLYPPPGQGNSDLLPMSSSSSSSSSPVSYIEEKIVLPSSPRRIPKVEIQNVPNVETVTIQNVPRRNLPKPPPEMNPLGLPIMANPFRILSERQVMTPKTPPTPLMQDVQVQETRTINSYEILGQLGKGGQGTVFKAKVKATGNIIALKVIKIPATEDREEIIKLIRSEIKSEIHNLVKISRPNCQPYLACYYASSYDLLGSQVLIEMEYVEGVTLHKWATENGSRRDFNAYLMAIMIKLTEAIKYINNLNIIHRDIKPENILIRKDQPVLLDFGLACQFGKYNESRKPDCYGDPGTAVFMAPETIKDKMSYFATDIWSLGATIYYAAVNNFKSNDKKKFHYPFVNTNDTKSVSKMIVYLEPFRLNTSSRRLNDAVNSCLNKNPLERITADQLLSLLSKNNLI